MSTYYDQAMKDVQRMDERAYLESYVEMLQAVLGGGNPAQMKGVAMSLGWRES